MSVFTQGMYARLSTDELGFGVTLNKDGSVASVDGVTIGNQAGSPNGALTKVRGSAIMRTGLNTVGLYWNVDGATAWRGFFFDNAGNMTLDNAQLAAGSALNVIANGNPGVPAVLPISITNGTGSSPYDTVLPTGPTSWEVVDASVQCQAADAGGTAQLQTGAGAAITDAMACAVDNTLARAASIDNANSTIAAGGTLRTVFAGGSAAGRGLVLATLLPRA